MVERSTIWQSWLVALVALGAAACSGEESLPQIDVDPKEAPATRTRTGSLVAEYAVPRGEAMRGLRVQAQFLDLQGFRTATALEALQGWSPDWELGVDACSLRSPVRPTPEQASQMRLELLDVGPITVEGPRAAVDLHARRLPDLVSHFSGVIYGTDDGFGARPSVDYHPGADYRFAAPGGPTTDGFGVRLEAPRPARIVEVGGVPTGDAFAIEVRSDRDVEIYWSPTAGRPDQAIFLELSAGYASDQPRLICRVEDDGDFTLPRTVVSQVLDPETASASLSLRRIAAAQVEVTGLDRTEFILSTVDELTLVVE